MGWSTCAAAATQEGGECRPAGRLEKDVGFGGACLGSELVQILPLNEEKVPGRVTGDRFGKNLSWSVIP